MKHLILRRRKLGRTSCREIASHIEDCRVLRNDAALPLPSEGSFAIRWGCTSNLPEGYRVINKAAAIHLVNDKTAFRRVLLEKQDENNPLVPDTWFNMYDVEEDDYPVVVRPARHSQGKMLFLCHTSAELEGAVLKCGAGYYITKFIKKVAEYRVAVVSGRAVWVAAKTPADPEAVAWNVAKGGRFDNVGWGDWPLKVVRKAIEAYKHSGLDFGGVDVMVDEDGDAFILEINSAPSQTSPYRQQCMGRSFAYLIANNLREDIPLVDQRGGWRKFIHPAVSEEALLV